MQGDAGRCREIGQLLRHLGEMCGDIATWVAAPVTCASLTGSLHLPTSPDISLHLATSPAAHLRVVDGLVQLGDELGRLRLDQRQQLLGIRRRLRAALGGGLGAAAALHEGRQQLGQLGERVVLLGQPCEPVLLLLLERACSGVGGRGRARARARARARVMARLRARVRVRIRVRVRVRARVRVGVSAPSLSISAFS